MNDKLKKDMYTLLGKLEAIRFPIIWGRQETENQSYYDLLDSIYNDYQHVLDKLMGGEDD